MNGNNFIAEKARLSKILWYGVLSIAVLNSSSPVFAYNIKSNKASYSIEIGGENMFDRLNNKLGMKLPDKYEKKVKELFINNDLISDPNIVNITESLVLDFMNENRGISKENQLLFVRYGIYLALAKTDLIEEDDLTKEDLSEFDKSLDYIDNCKNAYKEKLLPYVIKKLDQSKIDLDQSKIDLDQSKIDLDQSKIDLENELYRGLRELKRFYNLYKQDSKSIKNEELARVRDYAKTMIESCKKQGIDYKKYFSKELGSNEKVQELFRILEIE